MKSRIVAAIAAILIVAGCKQDGADNATPAAPVAAATAPAGRSWTETVVQTPEGGFRMGNPDAPIKLVEYGSRTCPTCGAFGQTGQKPLTERYVTTGKVSYEFRDYMVHGQADFAPSLLGRCASPAAFFPLLEQMYLLQPQFEEKLQDQAATNALQARFQGRPPIEAAQAWADYLGYVDFVKQRGITDAQARACLSDDKALAGLIDRMSTGDGATVTGTPTFILNGEKIDGVGWAEVEAALKRAGA